MCFSDNIPQGDSTPPPSTNPTKQTFLHSLFHINCNSLLKGRDSFNHSLTLSDQLYSNISNHKLVSLVDTRLSAKGSDTINKLFGNKFHVFNTCSNLSPPRAETTILISRQITNKIYKSYTFKLSNDDGYRAQAIFYHDKILNDKVCFANFYTPPSMKVHFIPKVYSFFTEIVQSNCPKYILIASDANIHLDQPFKRTTLDTEAFLFEHNLEDTYRFLFPNKNSHPGCTFPPKPNTNNNPTRVDYIYTSDSLLLDSPSVELIPNSILNTDHMGISFKFNKAPKFDYIYKFQDRFLLDKSFTHNLELAIREYLIRVISPTQDNIKQLTVNELSSLLPDYFLNFDGLNDLIQKTVVKVDFKYIAYAKNHNCMTYKNLQNKYLQILDKGINLPLSDRKFLTDLHNKMKFLTEQNTFYKAMKVTHQSLELGERPTKYFFNKF